MKEESFSQHWMIYGAYGYTGEQMAREAVRRGLRPVIAGRSETKLTPLAGELGLECRAFDLAQAKDGLQGISVLLNCAGPFSSTAKTFVAACLEAGIHYVDITGEIPVFEMCHCLDAKAKQAGVVLCPGAGFDIVPTDCLAVMLKERLPEAHTINLAFSFGTRPSIGTARTLVEGLEVGGLIRRNHQLTSVGNAYRIRRIAFPNGSRWGVTIPWGDVFTAGISTGVPNGKVYTALPLPLGLLMWMTSPLRGLFALSWVRRQLHRLVDRLFRGGPDAETRANQRSEFWGEALAAAGRRITMSMSAPNVYSLTVDTALTIAQHCLSKPSNTGYCTPSMLMGAGFVASRPGVVLGSEDNCVPKASLFEREKKPIRSSL